MQRFLVTTLLLLTCLHRASAGVITSLVETGGDGAPTAQFTGNTFTGPAAIGTYTVPAFGVLAKAFADRAHAYTNASGTVLIPPYLLGQEYIMIRNDNRDNNGGTNGGSANIYNLTVNISSGARVYLLIDNRVGDNNAANPPTFGPTNLTWVTNEGWAPVINGINRAANSTFADELGVDEAVDGTINSFVSVYTKTFPAGSFVLKQPNNPGRNMYGVVVALASAPAAPTGLTALNGDTQVTLNWTASGGASGYIIKRGSVTGGSYTQVGTSGTLSFTDTGLANATDYFYVVAATNAVGAGTNSIEVVGHPNPMVPSLVAVGGTNQVQLTWDALAGAESYTVYRAIAVGGPFTNMASGLVAISHADTAVSSGRTYYYRVGATLTGGESSGVSSTASATTAPSTPTVTSTLHAAKAIRLNWTTPDLVVSQFHIERSTDGTNFSVVAAPAGTMRGYTNAGLSAGTTYFYRVLASNSAGLADYSAAVSNTTPSFGVNVNFALGTAPTPPGYLQDIGEAFGDRTNSWFYGWTNAAGTNMLADARWRQAVNSPDLRYDTFNHMMKSAGGASWQIQLPNGFYSVRIVGGDPTGVDGTFQYTVNGVVTTTHMPVANAWWGDFTTNVSVSAGTLTIANGPSAVNNKICFVDIYADIPVAPVISAQPQSQTNEEWRVTSLSGAVSGSPALIYQWYFNDAPIEGGTNRVLTFNRLRDTNAGSYYFIVTNYGGAVTSDVATLTVLPDITAPQLVSVGSLDGNTVGIAFNEEINPGNGVAMDTLSYTINDGSSVYVTGVSIRPDNRTAHLVLSAPITGPFSVSVTAMPDFAGNPGDSTTTGVALGFTTGDVGAPLQAGTHFTADSQTVELVASGADIWSVGDQGYFATRSVTGDFDARVRVTALAGFNAVTKADLIARENLSSNAVSVHVSVNPQPPGRNLAQMGLRPTTGAGTANVGTNFPFTTIPNEWLRLVRIGSTVTGYRSGDGTTWTQLGQTNATLAASLQVGIALTSHDNNVLATGSFSGLSITAIPSVTATAGANGSVSPAGYTGVLAGDSLVFTATPDGGYVVGAWTLDGNPVQTGGSTCTVTNVQTSHALNVTFVSANTAPTLAAISNRVVHAGSLVILALMGSDSDLPANVLAYGLPDRDNTNATVDAAVGYFLWQTTALDAGTTNFFSASVTDGGSPGLSDSKIFSIAVLPPPRFRSITSSGGTNGMVIEGALDLGLYNFQHKPDLNGTNIIEDAAVSAASGDTAVVMDDTATNAPQRFYLVGKVNEVEGKIGGSRFYPTGPGTTVTSAVSVAPGIVTTSGAGAGGFSYQCVSAGSALLRIEFADGRKQTVRVTGR